MENNTEFKCTPALIATRKDNVSFIGLGNYGQDCLNCIDQNFGTKSNALKQNKANARPEGMLKPNMNYKPHCKEECSETGEKGCVALRNCKKAWQSKHKVFLQLDASKSF